MSDNKKYYYLKLKEGFYDDVKIQVIESRPNGVYYTNLLLKLYLKSLKTNGMLRVTSTIPYDVQMISRITNLDIDTVRAGLNVLIEMNLIEKLDDGTIYMSEIQNFIGKSSTEADRVRRYRNEINNAKLLCVTNVQEVDDKCTKPKNVTNVQNNSNKCNENSVTDVQPTSYICTLEIELEIKKDIYKQKQHKITEKNKNVNGEIKKNYDGVDVVYDLDVNTIIMFYKNLTRRKVSHIDIILNTGFDSDGNQYNPLQETKVINKEYVDYKNMIRVLYKFSNDNICPSVKDLVNLTGLKRNRIYEIKRKFEELGIIKTRDFETIILVNIKDALRKFKNLK